MIKNIKSLRSKYSVKSLDKLGGEIPSDLERAKKADLITLPKNVPGTNCSNCKFVTEKGKGHFCDHPEVQMVVTKKNCCAFWDAEGAIRAWES